jgi:hypothetical protein
MIILNQNYPNVSRIPAYMPHGIKLSILYMEYFSILYIAGPGPVQWKPIAGALGVRPGGGGGRGEGEDVMGAEEGGGPGAGPGPRGWDGQHCGGSGGGRLA